MSEVEDLNSQGYWNSRCSKMKWIFQITGRCTKCDSIEIQNHTNSLRIDRGFAARGDPRWLCACGSRKWELIERKALKRLK